MAKSAEQIARRAQLERQIADYERYVTEDAIAVSVATQKLEANVTRMNNLKSALADLDEIEGRDA